MHCSGWVIKSTVSCVTCTFVRCGREGEGGKVWEEGRCEGRCGREGVGGKVWEGGDIKPFTVLSVCTCIMMWGGRCEGGETMSPTLGNRRNNKSSVVESHALVEVFSACLEVTVMPFIAGGVVRGGVG